MEMISILDEIEILVADKLQVVSYKWLSREFMVSSNTAKRLLQEFANTREKKFQVVYTLAGWLKRNPTNYQIKLVPDPILEETKKEFEGQCSVHVYSVQACLPKDYSSLRDNEFAQSEELFKQPSNAENCLRDNRLGAIAAPFVKREIGGDTIIKPISYPDSLKSTSKLQQCSTSKAMKPEVRDTENYVEDAKPPLPLIGKNAKPTSIGNSLANIWDRASEKFKSLARNSAASSDAQIRESEFISDDLIEDDEEINFKRSDRKRRVVFDFSDDEAEESISLASPEHMITTEKPVSNEPPKPLSVIIEEKHKEIVKASSSPKKRKVLRTRIDERGREVTEVVFEDTTSIKDEIPKSDAVAKKEPTSKGKKAGNNDPKQGKILSFFKKV